MLSRAAQRAAGSLADEIISKTANSGLGKSERPDVLDAIAKRLSDHAQFLRLTETTTEEK